jgi:fatty-acid desaturase
MKSYNIAGVGIIVLYMLSCVYLAPARLGVGGALLLGGSYFLFCWFMSGLYLADVLHLGIAHRSLDYKEWFIKAVMVTNNLFGLYVDPIRWVYRHRLHHKYSDHAGDPNKLHSDGFWRTLYLCLVPYKNTEQLGDEKILHHWSFRVASSTPFAAFSQVFSFSLLWLLARDVKLTLAMWVGMRVFALWVNMIQNYFTHTPSYGDRRYDDARDHAMNIREWFPVTVTFSACLQNNHHHYPSLVRLTHEERDYDFGYGTVRVMHRLGLATPTPKGKAIPEDVRLETLLT